MNKKDIFGLLLCGFSLGGIFAMAMLHYADLQKAKFLRVKMIKCTTLQREAVELPDYYKEFCKDAIDEPGS